MSHSFELRPTGPADQAKISIQGREVGPAHPVYFIADIASNHGGALGKAKELIHACAEAKVDAVKMQNFTAATIVSDYGFKNLEGVQTHQSRWKQSVYDSYQAASIPLDWTAELSALTAKLGMHYFTSPYSIELAHAVTPQVCAFKIGSGDITWLEEISAIAQIGKPVLLATGASQMEEVEEAMNALLTERASTLLMQCNTEYSATTGETRAERLRRFEHINLRVLETYARRWPKVPVGLSDHTHGPLTVLGAVGLFDCCAVEKHFTLDNSIEGQDHAFSMMPTEWRAMVDQTEALRRAVAGVENFEQRYALTRAAVDDEDTLKAAIGDGRKRLASNETATVIVQRRAIRAARDLVQGELIRREDLSCLRPCPGNAIPPSRLPLVIGKGLRRNIPAGDLILSTDLTES